MNKLYNYILSHDSKDVETLFNHIEEVPPKSYLETLGIEEEYNASKLTLTDYMEHIPCILIVDTGCNYDVLQLIANSIVTMDRHLYIFKQYCFEDVILSMLNTTESSLIAYSINYNSITRNIYKSMNEENGAEALLEELTANTKLEYRHGKHMTVDKFNHYYDMCNNSYYRYLLDAIRSYSANGVIQENSLMQEVLL